MVELYVYHVWYIIYVCFVVHALHYWYCPLHQISYGTLMEVEGGGWRVSFFLFFRESAKTTQGYTLIHSVFNVQPTLKHVASE